jgi:DNA polymerase-3 subunit alpha
MYISLHHHSTHSLNDALGSVDAICAKAAALNMPAVALTEHGTVSPFAELYKSASKHNIKPIFGAEFYFSDIALNQQKEQKSKEYSHVVLLAENLSGYHNLVKLSSIANTEGFYYRPRISWNEIEQHNEGIISLSACVGGLICKLLKDDRALEAEERLQRWNDIFKDRFYLEVQKHPSVDIQEPLNAQIIALAGKYSLPVVATNDVHFVEPSHLDTHKILLSKKQSKKLGDKNFVYVYDESFYFKSEQEMLDQFDDKYVHQSGEIADRIEIFNPSVEDYNLPQFKLNDTVLDEETASTILAAKCALALEKKSLNIPQYNERLKEELKIIADFGFSNYLLIVADELDWCRNNHIATGPSRGSSASSLVNYLCGITAFDPVHYNLDFARFLNEGRIKIENGKRTYTSMIDIDCDISRTGRDRFLEHLSETYGHVYHLGTHLRYTVKTAVKAVGTALGVSATTMNEFTELLTESEPGTRNLVSLDWNIKQKQVADFITRNNLQKVVQLAKPLEGGYSARGIHASGIVMSRTNIDHIVPVRRGDEDAFPVIEFDMESVEKFTKQIKFDFLGLRNVTVIEEAEHFIKQRHAEQIIPEYSDFSDTSVLAAEHGLDNIFQLSSALAQKYYRATNPKNELELADVISIIRPGVSMSGWADQYVKGGFKHKISALNQLLKSSRGIMVYQEQIMEIAKKIAGFTPAKADDLRSACGKKIPEKMALLLDDFEQGAIKNGYTHNQIEYIVKQIKDAALYAFNMGHAMSYAALAYKTLWLKHYFPTEFYCAVLNSYIGKSEEIKGVVNNIRQGGYRLLLPNINTSGQSYTVEYDPDPAIRIGLGGIKGVGPAALKILLELRPFSSVDDFITRVPKRQCNKRVVEALINAGAFDTLCGRDDALSLLTGTTIVTTQDDQAYAEYDVLGDFFTYNPYMAHACFKQLSYIKPSDVLNNIAPHISVIGFVEDFSIEATKKNKSPYVNIIITDGLQNLKAIGFSKVVEEKIDILTRAKKERLPITISGQLSTECGEDGDIYLPSCRVKIQDPSQLNLWEPQGSTLMIRVADEFVEPLLEDLPTGDCDIVIYSVVGRTRREVKTTGYIDEPTLHWLREVYGARIKYV